MCKFKFIFAGLAVVFFYSCSSTQVGLKENWIDERDMIALVNAPVSSWMQTAGRPTLVEISGDTGIYYYNFRPTMYATTIHDSSFFKPGTKTEEVKPGLANAVEVWGSRKNLIQIKVVNDIAVSAIVFEGPDKKTFVRDLNGDLVLDSKSGFAPNYSVEQKFDNRYSEFIKAYSSLASSAIKTNVPTSTAAITTKTSSSGSLPEASLQASPANISGDTTSVAASPNHEETAQILPPETAPAPDAATHATHEPHPAHAESHPAAHAESHPAAHAESHPATHAEPHPVATEPAPAGSTHHSSP